MRRALVASLLGSLILVVSPAVASAHAELESSTPRNGAQLTKAPSSVEVTFGEPVTLDVPAPGIVSSAGTGVATTAQLSGTTITLRPAARLPRGDYAVTWHVISTDGHPVSGAISFSVGAPGPKGTPTAVTTTPGIATTLDGRRSGPLTATFARGASSGEVVWSHPGLSAPITWRVTDGATRATATGVLPLPGPWTMSATLVGRDMSVIVIRGTVRITR